MDSQSAVKTDKRLPLLFTSLALGIVAIVLSLLYCLSPNKHTATGASVGDLTVESAAVKLQLAGQKLAEEKLYDKAIIQFDEALKIAPDAPLILMDRAAAYYKKGDFVSALRDYQTAAAQKNTAATKDGHTLQNDASFGVALSEKALHEGPLAMKTLRQLLARDGKYVGVYQLEGDIYLDDNNSEAAIDAYTQGLRQNPLSADLHYDRAVAYLRRNMTSQAFADFDRAVELDHKNLTFLLKHANLAQKLHKLDVADKDARQILELEPANRTAIAWLKHRGQSPKAHGPASKPAVNH